MTFATAPAAWRYLPRSFAPHLCLHSATKEKPFSKLWVGIIIALRFVRCVTTRKPDDRYHTRLSAFDNWLRGLTPSPLSPERPQSHQIRALVMKIERFAGHHEARDALVLSVAGVTAIMLIESLILRILY